MTYCDSRDVVGAAEEVVKLLRTGKTERRTEEEEKRRRLGKRRVDG